MIIVLLPAYNEEESLPQLMPKLQQTLTGMDENEFFVIHQFPVADGGTAPVQMLGGQ